ncbi:MAG: FAD-dependent oxidoreductase [Chromatiales bacterium]|nr:FAD-dependent oxidoreductase [Chromatiales bacterium]
MLTRDFDKAQSQQYDVVVVGGGIYGATIAREAISRGLSVALVEQRDFGGATSANSLKVIHGGIRYLQSLDIKRLRESVNERRALLRIAPHLVSPIKCIIPTRNSLTQHRFTVSTAFQLYNLLSLDRNRGVDSARHILAAGTMDKQALHKDMPSLGNCDCTGAGYWYDAQAHNTERLVLSFILTAVREGATALNYATAVQLLQTDGRVAGIVVRDNLSENRYTFRAKSVVDCTGPWVKWRSEKNETCSEPVFAKAVNFVVKKSLFPCAVGLKVDVQIAGKPRSRQLFIAPWRGASIIGTWYFPVSEPSPDNTYPTDEEFDVCLAQANALSPDIVIERDDVINVHAGLLPATSMDGVDGEPVLKSRPVITDIGSAGGVRGLFLVQGVKLTTARDVAALTVDSVLRFNGKEVSSSTTDVDSFYGGNLGGVDDYYKLKLEEYGHILSADLISRLIDDYGTNVDVIMSYIDDSRDLARLVPGTSSLVCAELLFSIQHEMAVTLSDVLLRRVGIGALAIPSEETIGFCSDFIGQYLSWSEHEKDENVKSLKDSYYHLLRQNDASTVVDKTDI